MRSLSPRILVGLALTGVAVVVLLINALVGGSDNAEPSPDQGAVTTSSTTSTTSASTTQPEVVTSVVVDPDWYPKGSSRYSDREPPLTITTLTTSTTSTSTTSTSTTSTTSTTIGR